MSVNTTAPEDQVGQHRGQSDMSADTTPHILFVDDDAKMCELLALYFEAKGLRLTAATTAAQAEGLIHATRFDLAILGVNLGGVSGLDLLELIKRETPAVPVLMFTGLEVDEDLVSKTLHGRAEGIIHKTQSLEGILTAVRWQLAKAPEAHGSASGGCAFPQITAFGANEKAPATFPP